MTDERIAYRPDEAAKALGCSRDMIDRLISAGELRGFKVGTARFISCSELERFIAEREGESGGGPAHVGGRAEDNVREARG